MYGPRGIKRLHVEVTTRCNAACPMCARNIQGGEVNPKLPLSELSAQDMLDFFPDDFVANLEDVSMCGNFGDPAAARELLQICKDFKRRNEQIKISVHSNGGLRDPAWWQELSSTIDVCHFGIDGLEDTNHLYRRKVLWTKLMENVESFIAAKQAKAVWDFIVFRHNQHQIGLAKDLSHQLGFHRFQAKKTGRFLRSRDFKVLDRHPVHSNSSTEDAQYWIERPDWNYVNSALKRIMDENPTVETVEKYLDTTPISCKATSQSSLYLSAEGLVFPCCWIAGRLYNWFPSEESRQVDQMIELEENGQATLSLRKNSLSKILESRFFTHTLPSSWKEGSTKHERSRTCARTCGLDWESFSNQFATD